MFFLQRRRIVGVGMLTASWQRRNRWMEDWTCRKCEQIPCRPNVGDRCCWMPPQGKSMRKPSNMKAILRIKERCNGLVCRCTQTNSGYAVLDLWMFASCGQVVWPPYLAGVSTLFYCFRCSSSWATLESGRSSYVSLRSVEFLSDNIIRCVCSYCAFLNRTLEYFPFVYKLTNR